MRVLDKLDVRYVDSAELPDFDLDHILMNVNTAEEYEIMNNLLI